MHTEAKKSDRVADRMAFDLPAAAVAVSLSVSGLRKLIAAGKLRDTRVGRRVLIRRKSLAELLDRGIRVEAGASPETHPARHRKT